MLLLIAECNFTKKKLLLQTFSNKSSKIDYQWNIAITYFVRILSGKLYTNFLNFYPSHRLVLVHGCNLALLAEFLLFLRPKKKAYLKSCTLFNKTVCFSSMVFFPALIFCLFLLKCSDAHLCSLLLTTFWMIKIMYWKSQNCRSCIFVKS